MNCNNQDLTVKVQSTWFEYERYFRTPRGIISYLRTVRRLHRAHLEQESKRRWHLSWSKRDIDRLSRKYPLKVSIEPLWVTERRAS